MLSIENPSTDPCQISSQLKCSDDEIHNKLDLPNSQQVISNFSIRDYVFAARSKDIKNNWPFSLKNLQLCFKHGVKDVLPPFQPLRNKSINRHAGEIISSDRQNTSHVDREPCEPDDHEMPDSAQLNQKLLDTCTTTKCSCGQSEIELVHNNRPSSSTTPPIKAGTLLEDSVEIEGVASHFSHKTDNESRTPSKKCKLIVRFGGNSDRSSLEDMASNCMTLSESMTSKVCPVCRTFSSSSNTTLNAHIDQCLSIESSPKWTTNSKLTRHSRIKPRRTRLMVDIYVDAKRCTLEELDRRNGRIFNAISRETDQKKVEMSDEGWIKSRVHPSDVGPVYIDANGTKLRILSKFKDDQPVSEVGENVGLRKALKGSKLSKLISAKKKKRHALMKHNHEYLKLGKKKFYSPKTTHTSQVYRPQERRHRDGESVKEDEHQIPKPTKPSDAAATLQQWVCSKRTGLAKKTIDQDDRHSYKRHDHRDQSCLRDSVVVGRTRIQKFTNLSENVLSFPQSGKRKCKPINEKRSLLEARIADDMDRSPIKQNFTELRKDGPSVHDCCEFKPSEDSDGLPTVSRKTFTSNHATTPKTLKFSSLRNNILSESSFGATRKCSAFKNTDSHVDDETDEEVDAYHSVEGTENQFGTEESTDDDMSLDFGNECTFTKEKTATFQSYSLDEEENSESSAGGASDYILDKVDSYNGSVMSWRKSVGSKLQKLTIPTTTSPMEPSLEDSTFCNHEVGDDDCMRVYSDTEAGKGNSLIEVDPILIPGPPGSFLPSPRDMGSDDFRGNSSLTTSRVHSSQDQRDLVDGGSSTSPISAASSILNASVSVKTTPNGDFLKFDGKRPLGFRNDDIDHQPCCCQKKGRVSQGVILNFQESQLLKRRQARAPMGKEWENNPNTRTSHLDIIGPGKFPFANFESEKAVLPVMKSPEASGVNFFASLASNPVLRLMGKNLMVINKDDDAFAPQAQPCSEINHPTLQFPTRNTSKRDCTNSYHHVVIPDSARSIGQYFNAASLSTSYRASSNFPEPAGIFLDRQTMNGRNFGDLTPRHNYEGDENNATCKEIILIDDIPEDNQISASMPTVCSYNAGPNNVFACFWPQGSSLRSESAESPPVGSNIGNHVTAFRRVNSSFPVKWNCSPETPQQKSSFVVPSTSSTSHLNYYPPSFQ